MNHIKRKCELKGGGEMSRKTMIEILSEARCDIPKSFWDSWSDEELALQINLVKIWMCQHAQDAIFN
jgi:hypothetical protein